MKLNSFITLFTLLLITSIAAQKSPFQVAIEPMTIPGLGGVQAFAFGQDDGKWLIIGGD